jgi:hypothetical protein
MWDVSVSDILFDFGYTTMTCCQRLIYNKSVHHAKMKSELRQ